LSYFFLILIEKKINYLFKFNYYGNSNRKKAETTTAKKNAAHGLRDLFAVGLKTFIMPKKY
jgi:hypothetical protein